MNKNLAILSEKLEKIKILSNFNIKIIATLLMVIEHFIKIILYIGYCNYSDFSMNLQEISIIYIYKATALAFPLFCFLIIEGFIHTKNKNRYILTMLIFAFISEIPFDFAFFINSEVVLKNEIFLNIFYFGYQNVFFTLFLGLVSIYIIENIEKNNSDYKKSILLKILIITIISIIASFINCDYEYRGILLISLFYIFRKNRIYQILVYLALIILLDGKQPNIYNFIYCIIIFLYNGKLYNNIKLNRKLKYIFYLIYPLHIMLFGFLDLYIQNQINL